MQTGLDVEKVQMTVGLIAGEERIREFGKGFSRVIAQTPEQGQSPKWIGVYSEKKEELTDKGMFKEIIARGNTIEVNILGDGNSKIAKLENIILIKKAEVVSDDDVNLEVLLNCAHDKFKDGLTIETELIEKNEEKKTAFFKCTVRTQKGTFTGHGDVNRENVSSDFIAPHWFRFAETRAICRALRWATNEARCPTEEKA